MRLPLNEIKILYEGGMSDAAIAERYGVTRKAISYWRKKLGIITRPMGSWMRDKKRPNHAVFMRAYLAEHGHPYKGKKHKASTIAKMKTSRSTTEYKARIYTKERNQKISETRRRKYGTKNVNARYRKLLFRKSAAYKQWRTTVFKRDAYTCQKCNTTGGYLEAHHLDGFVNFPLLRIEVSNGLTLCRACHKRVRSEEHTSELQSLS